MFRPRTGWLALLVLAMISVAVAGCSSTTLTNEEPALCTKHSDCPGGKICVDGACITFTSDGDSTDNADDVDTVDTDIQPDGDDVDATDDSDISEDTDDTEQDRDTDPDAPDQAEQEMPPEALTVPESLAFGTLTIGESLTKNLMIGVAQNAGSVKITNISTQDYQGENGCAAYDVSEITTFPVVLAEPSTLALPVVFAPEAAGRFDCLIRIDYGWPGDRPQSTLAAFVPLAGNGTTTTERCIKVTPVTGDNTAGIDFGPVALDQSRTQTLRIESCSSQPLTITSITPDDTDINCQWFGECPEFTFSPGLPMNNATELRAGGHLDIQVTFSPSRAVEQAWGLHIASNALVSDPGDPGDPADAPENLAVTLSGTGIDIQYRLSPESLSLPGATPECCSAPGMVELANTGTGTMQVTGAVVDNAMLQFVNRPSLPLTLGAGASASFSVRLCPPAQAATGPVNGQLSLALHMPEAGLDDVAMVPIHSKVLPRQMSEIFHQPDEVKADILWVVDCSGSMYEEQQQLSSAASSFINTAVNRGANLHIGITSTDMEDTTHQGRLLGTPAVITTDNPQNAISQFSANVMLGTGCSGTEKGFDPMQAAITEPLISGANAGFLRPDAKLLVVFLSDEEEQSAGTVSAYVNVLAGVKNNNPALYTAFAIVGDCPGGCAGNTGDAAEGCRYTDFAGRVNGTTSSICANSYIGITNAIVDAAVSFPDTFRLAGSPQLSSLQVRVNDQLQTIDSDYTFNAATNAVRFYDAPPAGATINITYQLLCAN